MKLKKKIIIAAALISLLLSSCGNMAGEEGLKDRMKTGENIIITSPVDIEMEREISLVKKNAVEKMFSDTTSRRVILSDLL